MDGLDGVGQLLRRWVAFTVAGVPRLSGKLHRAEQRDCGVRCWFGAIESAYRKCVWTVSAHETGPGFSGFGP